MQTLVPPPGENAATAAPSIPRPTHFRRSTPPQAFGRHTSPRQQVWRRLRIRLCRPRPSLPKHTTPCAQQRRLRGLTIFSHHFAPCSIQLKLGVTINRKFSSQVKGDLDTHLRHEECKQRTETQNALYRPTRSHTVLAFPPLENATSPDQSIERAALSCWNMRSTGRPRSRSASRTSSSVL
jgi:hypothetical protein